MADYSERMKDYIQVNERIIAFYEMHPEGSIQSEIVELTRPRYYILNDEHVPIPVDLSTWDRWFGDINNRSVGYDEIDGFRVLTVMLGVDHNFAPTGPPLLFETMVFRDKAFTNLYMDRYPTWELALEGHRQVCAMVRDGEIR